MRESKRSFGIFVLFPAFLFSLSICHFTVSAEPGKTDSKEIEKGRRPFNSRLVVNPVIQEMVDSVSSDIMMENLEALVDFYTRHTNSDTVSDDMGIGAARRYIYDRLMDYATDPNAVSLEPGYFVFDATVCGLQGEHRNVMGTMTGMETPHRYFIDMGHMDSRTHDVCDNTSFAPSANDDGSGTVVAMEMARVMSRYMFESTVVILIVTGEDQGLYGSTAYANWALYGDIDIETAITNDVVGNIEGCEDPSCPPGDSVIIDSTSVRLFSGPPATGSSRQLARYMRLKAMEYVDGFTIDLIPAIDRPGRSGDHVPFHYVGFPAARFTEAHENGDGSGDNGRQHNEFDIISPMNTNAGYMANIAKINIAAIASLALAPAPPSGLEVMDMGDGHRALLAWPDNQMEPDFAGYRIAVRPEDELFYSDIVDAEAENEYLLEGLEEGQTVFLSISAYDIDGNESLFSEEVDFTPRRFPRVPSGLDATSTAEGVRLAWIPNDEIDMQGYRVYRQSPEQADPELIDTIQHPNTEWLDSSVLPLTLYLYFISAVDSESLESDLSGPVMGQLVTHDEGILVVDGTIDGNGNPFQPTDQQVDDYYNEILSEFNVNGYWDVFDSNSVDLRITDAHMAPFSVVMIHCDRPGAQLYPDTTALRKYLSNGGGLLLGGWNLSLAIAGVNADIADFPDGSFFEDYLKVDSIGISSSQNRDFIKAPSLIPANYPDLIIDSVKVPLFDNRLFRMEAFFGPLLDQPTTEPIYTYESSLGGDFPLHGKPDGLRYIGDDFKVVLIDVPLYFIKQEIASQAVYAALEDLGEVQSGVGESMDPAVPGKLEIHHAFPNPFNASTTLSFRLPESGDVRLSIYNILGQEIETILDEPMNAGDHRVVWRAGDIPSGIYFARIYSNGASANIRMILLK